MKIVIALASSSRHLSGVQRHAINLAQCLLTRREITGVHLIAAPWQVEFLSKTTLHHDARLHLHAACIGDDALSRNFWYYFELPKFAAKLGADIVHLAFPAPLRARAFHCPTVVTLHDLYPYDIPGNFGFPKVLVNRLILRQCLSAGSAIACVSHNTLSRLEELDRRLSSEKATVIYNYVEMQTRVSLCSPLPQWRGQPFLLCVAQHRINKNIVFLLRVFADLLNASKLLPETQLVIVGIEGPETESILRVITEEGIADRVVLLSGMTDAELQWCYRHCEVLLAPSVIEGFGLPIAEGLLAGCRVICSDIPAFREIGGEHCHFIPLNAVAEATFAEAIETALRAPSPEPVAMPHLSAPVIAEKYLSLYEAQLLSTRSAGQPLSGALRNSRTDPIL